MTPNRTLDSLTIFFFTLCSFMMGCQPRKQTQAPNPPLKVEIEVYFNEDYCGGAKPSETLLNKLKELKTLNNIELVFEKEGILSHYTTKENGTLSLKLSEGTYRVYFPNKLSAKGDSKKCQEWKLKPNGMLIISKGIEKIRLQLHKDCSPCGPKRR